MTFGRKGLAQNRLERIGQSQRPSQRPANAKRKSLNARTSAAFDTAIASEKKNFRHTKLQLYPLIGLLLLLLIESAFSSTELITPINTTYLNTARGLGFVLGIGLLWVLRKELLKETSTIQAIIMLVMTPLFGAGLLNYSAWRAANHWEFALSSTAFETAHYPVTYADYGRKGWRDTVSIDPFHSGDIEIPIPAWQYDEIKFDYDGLCVAVQQRVSKSGAIQIVTDGSFTASEPEALSLLQCGEISQLSEF